MLTFRYHVGRHLSGCSVEVENAEGLLHVIHNGVLVATHAKRHLDDDDAKFEGRPKATRPAPPTTGTEVKRIVDHWGFGQFRRHGLSRRQQVQRPRGRRPACRRYGPDHDRRPTGSHSPGPTRQVQGVRGPGPAQRQAEEEPRWCRVATGAKAGHGCRTSTPLGRECERPLGREGPGGRNGTQAPRARTREAGPRRPAPPGNKGATRRGAGGLAFEKSAATLPPTGTSGAVPRVLANNRG